MYLRLVLLLTLFVLAAAGMPAPQAAGNLRLTVIHPLDGQVLYAGEPAPRYVIPVSGRASLADGTPAAYALQIDVYHQQRLLSSYRGLTEATGDFEVLVTVNPEAAVMGVPPERYYCRECHDTPADLSLAGGDNTVVVTVSGAQGERAVVERRVFVDYSGFVELVAKIEAEGGPSDLSGVPVVATTEFPVTANSATDVQTREFRALADASGRARLQIETLRSQALRYRLSVPPTASGGRLLVTAADAELVVPADAREGATVALTVQGKVGGISGSVGTPAGSQGQLAVRAVALGDAASYAAAVTGRDFSLAGLAPDSYRVALFGGGTGDLLLSHVHTVDLLQAGQASLDLQAVADWRGEVQGVVHEAGGEALPFVWITAAGGEDAVRGNPANGAFVLGRSSSGTLSASIIAPGYWSKLQVADAGADADVALTARPDLRRLSLAGDGQASLPAETLATVGVDGLLLHMGWVWGRTGSAPWRITLAAISIEVAEHSRFAIEAPAGRPGRLYVLGGQATLRAKAQGQGVVAAAGQMVLLPTGASVEAPPTLRAAPIEPGALALLDAGESVPLPFAGEPTLRAQISNGLARLGIGAAQAVTLAGYVLLVLGAGAGLLLLGARLRR